MIKGNLAASSSAREAPRAFGVDAGTVRSAAEVDLLERVRSYLAAIEADTDPETPEARDGALAFYHPDIIQVELPNRLVSNGMVRNLDAIREAASRGRGVLRGQRYEVRSAMVMGNRVALETLWVGVLAVPFGKLAAGDEMRAHFAMFMEFEGDLIIGQRNYDCFDQF